MSTNLDTALEHLTGALQEFNALLEEEASALASQDTDTLSALLPRRNALHQTLATRWLAVAHLAGTRTPQGLADLRGRLFATRPVPPAWTQLEALVHASDRLNRINGQRMEEQVRRTQVALQILRSAVASRGVYGADGQVTDLHAQARSIDSA